MLFIYLKLCRKYNYHLIINIWLGNVHSTCQCNISASECCGLVPHWPLQHGDRWPGQWGRFPTPGWQLRHSKGTEFDFLALAIKVSHTVLFPVCWFLLIPHDLTDWLEEEAKGEKLCLTSCWFVLLCSSPEWDSVEPKYREALLRNKDDGEFWYFPIDPLSTGFSIHLH